MRWLLITCIATLLLDTREFAQAVEVKAVQIDSSAGESLLCVRADTHGRLLVGGVESLFLYEPNGLGGYQPRKLLYRFPPRTFVNDIEIRGNDLYVLTLSALYLIPDGVRHRANLQPRKLIWGVPRGDVGQGFRACAWGPEGDLYLALSAQRWGYWTFFSQPTENKTPYNGAGCVLRCKPDGSGLLVVVRGLRNADGLVFDRYWNLFGCDSQDNAGRLLHITPHAYFGGSTMGAETAQPMLDALRTSRISALSYNHDALLAVRGDDVLRLSIDPRGASLQTTEYASVQAKSPSAVSVGAGRVFAILSKSSLITLAASDKLLSPYDAADASAEKLWRELSDPSWQRRYRAHVEMMRRGGDFLKQANRQLLDAKASDPSLHHLIWLAAKSGQGSLHLLSLVDHADPSVRVQTIRALTEFPDQLVEEPIFLKGLLDEQPQVRQAAMSAYFSPKISWGRAVQLAIERRSARSTDSYLRQTAALLLAQKATRKQIEDLCFSNDVSKRLAGVLAAGLRLTLPTATKPLLSHLPLGKYRDQSAYVIDYADGKVDLRDHGRLGIYTIAQHWAADKQTDEQNLLIKLLRTLRADEDRHVSSQASSFLAILR